MVHEICAPTPRKPSGPSRRPLTSGESANSQVCGWVGLIRPKASKNCPPFNCKTKRQTGRLQERLFEFDLGFVVVVQLEDDVGEALEVGIDCAVERDFGVARIEAALLRIVIAHFDVIEIVARLMPPGRTRVERDVHVILVGAAGE